MTDSFSKLKANHQNNLDKLSKQLFEASATASNAKRETDERLWYPNVDKSGNGAAIIRFLPATEGEDVPFVRLFSHSFQGPTGQWYIENCLTTIGKQDPVAELNSKLWNSGVEANKEIARKQKRKLTFMSNIYVIKDPANPENEGTVRLFKFGKKIFDKINDRANPAYEEDPKIDVFDLWSGADFRMRITTIDKWRNYDKSEFGPQGALFDDDAKMEAIWKQQYPLQPFVAADQFKSYSELKAKLNRVLGEDEVVSEQNTVDETLSDDLTTATNSSDDSDEMKLFDDLAKM